MNKREDRHPYSEVVGVKEKEEEDEALPKNLIHAPYPMQGRDETSPVAIIRE